jgi:hypothetical protein
VVAATALEHNLRIHDYIIPVLPALAGVLMLVATPAMAELDVVIVEGLGGEPLYTEQFDEQVSALEQASQSLTTNDRIRVFRASDASKISVLAHFDLLSSRSSADDTLAIYFVGHGSYDDHEYKFNLPGPDLTGDDIAAALTKQPNENVLFVNTGSSSGATAELLLNDQRTLILATRSGSERHATRFGIFFTAALSDDSADTDKNSIITAQEAFAYADRSVANFYERDGLLATEHARLEGNNANRFSVARLNSQRQASSDDEITRLTADRDALNSEVEALRLRKDEMTAEEYQAQLLQKMLELARLEDAIEIREMELGQSE